MDPFERLPSELVQQIIACTGDFTGVESILLASPQVNAVFQAQPARILKDLILSNSITCMPEIERLCYNIGLLNNPSLYCKDLDDYHQTCEGTPALGYTKSLYVIQIGAQIQRLACTCLSFMQQNLISTMNNIPAGSLFDGPPLNIQIASNTFSWTEEYRVYWALWHLQHYSHLRKAATNRWGWEDLSIQCLDAYNTWNDIEYHAAEKLWTVAAVLSDMGLGVNWLADHPEAEEPSQTVWPGSKETAIPFFPLLDLPPASTPIHHGSLILWTPPALPPETEATHVWSLTPQRRSRRQVHVDMFHRKGTRLTRNCSPASYTLTKIKPWRRFGWAIWDSWRMYAAGLSGRIRYRRPIPTPDGSMLKGEPQNLKDREPAVDYVARWFAMVGEERPFHCRAIR
ncbi:hypothetical protein BJX63DRAFT_338796 [Aspergillus granulosus]|uniref:F-box domain-containing protein n=1 Tax=Aspergillus granulosus TaxID=176169 RepID=A0ABR4H385_9EURO